jgi:hypothetical protein
MSYPVGAFALSGVIQMKNFPAQTLPLTVWLNNPESLLKGYDWTTPSYHVSYTGVDMEDNGWIEVATSSIDVPAVILTDLVAPTVAALRATLQKKRADFEMECQNVEASINDLLMIGYESANPSEAIDDIGQ